MAPLEKKRKQTPCNQLCRNYYDLRLPNLPADLRGCIDFNARFEEAKAKYFLVLIMTSAVIRILITSIFFRDCVVL